MKSAISLMEKIQKLLKLFTELRIISKKIEALASSARKEKDKD